VPEPSIPENSWFLTEINKGYLTIITGSSTSISSIYIVFVTKMQKRQIPLEEFALIEKRYHRF
jgi:hypothetical protein